MVPCSPQQMFDVVADVDAYPQFLPGCRSAHLRSKTDTELVGTLTLALAGISSTFTTRNKLDPPGKMGVELIDGPFRTLRGGWTFEPVGDKGCRLTLRLEFEFSNPAKDLLLGAIFETTCNATVQAFVSRAHSVYG